MRKRIPVNVLELLVTVETGKRDPHRPGRAVLRAVSWSAILVAAAGTLTACSRDAAPAPEVPPAPAATRPSSTLPTQAAQLERPTVLVQRQTLRRYVPAVGTFRARQSTRLGPQVSGRVEEVLVNVGDHVKAGQLLVRLDPAFFEIEVNQALAALDAAQQAVASAEVDLADAEREKNRQVQLFERGIGSVKDRDDALARFERASAKKAEQAARVVEAQRRLEYARQRLDETEIRAPYDGAITARLVDPGEPAAATPPTHLVEIQELDALYLEYSLPQELLAVVHSGTPVEFEVEGVTEGRAATTVAVIYPAVDEATRSFRCRSIVGNLAGTYQPGLLARVRVVAEEVPDALVVPRTALNRTGSGWEALVSNDGHPVPRRVEVGVIGDDLAQIRGGLKEGERVFSASKG
ncbi:MAG: efflux RND transporter periplasmic adaptor subunit [Planctomycetota bacterium]